MFYIIDGNNVAGKLKMLGEENFDKKFIEMVRVYNQSRNSLVLLVFDGHEQMELDLKAEKRKYVFSRKRIQRKGKQLLKN